MFRNGGTIEYDNGTQSVQTSVLNELIVQECIESSRLSNQAQLRLGKSGEYTARLCRTPETDANVAVLYPVALKVLNDPDALVSDVAKIYASIEDDFAKFEALVNVRLQSSVVKAQNKTLKNSVSEPPKMEEVQEPQERELETKSRKKVNKSKKGKPKKNRTWDDASDFDSDAVLDYSESQNGSARLPTEQLNALDLGSRSKDGFVVKELSDELSEILSSKNSKSTDSSTANFGFLKRYVGGKILGHQDIKNVLTTMEDHLVKKNVAKEVATQICEGVGKDLVGTSTCSWATVSATVRQSMQQTLSRILTPSISTDLLASIRKQKAKSGSRPFVISVVGVNGVGKSTNLGKLGFWFLQNDFKVLIAACDTFRSGAVEQLKVHVQRLQQLKGRSSGEVELFHQGYGKDAAVIAKRAVEHAQKIGYDVVLIDTAGRRHNDDRLMSSLEKFGNLAQPDKIIMVGEALVGTDSVEQARNFDAAFGKSRGLDFFLISKCDTVGEMLGTLVNVTYATGVPVLFVGVGQQYTDLRTLSVSWAVEKLLH